MSNHEPVAAPGGIRWSRWLNTFGTFLALVLVFMVFAIQVGESWWQVRNLEYILLQSAVYATAGLGMTMVIITAGIDLSAGSAIALGVVVFASVISRTAIGADGTETALIESMPVLLPCLGILACVAACTLAGCFNGVMITQLRLVPFIVTLGTMLLFRGAAKGISSERDIYPPQETWVGTLMDPTMADPSRRHMLFAPGIWILIVCAAFAFVLMRYTRLGRHIYAVGSNEETARLCGVPVARTKIIVYSLAGFFFGLSALMQYSYIGSYGVPTTAIMYELYIIAAVIIGGASFTGGEGNVLSTIIGALIITILYMGGQQAGWDKWVQECVIGGIIIAAVAIDQLRHRKDIG